MSWVLRLQNSRSANTTIARAMDGQNGEEDGSIATHVPDTNRDLVGRVANRPHQLEQRILISDESTAPLPLPLPLPPATPTTPTSAAAAGAAGAATSAGEEAEPRGGGREDDNNNAFDLPHSLSTGLRRRAFYQPQYQEDSSYQESSLLARADSWNPKVAHRAHSELERRKEKEKEKEEESQRSKSRSMLQRGDEKDSDAEQDDDDDDNMSDYSMMSEELYDGARDLTHVARPRASKGVRGLCQRVQDAPATCWRFLLTLGILITATALIVYLAASDFHYVRDSASDWQSMLLDSELTPDSTLSNEKHIITLDTAVDAVRSVVTRYYSANMSVDNFFYLTSLPGSNQGPLVSPVPVPVQMTVEFNNMRAATTPQMRMYQLTPDDLGPFEMQLDDLQSWLQQVQAITLKVSLRHLQFLYKRFCIDWDIDYRMDFRHRGHLWGYLQANSQFCPASDNDSSPSVVLTMYGVLVFLSAISFFSALPPLVFMLRNQCIRMGWVCRFCNNCKRKKDVGRGGHLGPVRSGTGTDSLRIPLLQPNPSSFSHHSSASGVSSTINHSIQGVAWVPKENINTSWWVAIFADIFNLASAFVAINERVNYVLLLSNKQVHLLSGMGVFLSWIRLLPFVGMLGSEYNAFRATLVVAFPTAMRFFVGLLPIYLGFVTTAVVFFDQTTHKFSTVGFSSETLYALLNGDELFDTFNAAHKDHPIFSRIFLYAFCSLFIFVVLQVILAGVEFWVFTQIPACEPDQIDQGHSHGHYHGHTGQHGINAAPGEVVSSLEFASASSSFVWPEGVPVPFVASEDTADDLFETSTPNPGQRRAKCSLVECSQSALGRYTTVWNEAVRACLDGMQMHHSGSLALNRLYPPRNEASHEQTLKASLDSKSSGRVANFTIDPASFKASLRSLHSFDAYPCASVDCLQCRLCAAYLESMSVVSAHVMKTVVEKSGSRRKKRRVFSKK